MDVVGGAGGREERARVSVAGFAGFWPTLPVRTALASSMAPAPALADAVAGLSSSSDESDSSDSLECALIICTVIIGGLKLLQQNRHLERPAHICRSISSGDMSGVTTIGPTVAAAAEVVTAAAGCTPDLAGFAFAPKSLLSISAGAAPTSSAS